MKTDLVLYIPDYELKTTDARSVLPASLQMDTATTASAVSNVMLAALLSEDYQLAGDMMEKDMFHEIYRNKLLPEYTKTKQADKKYSAYGILIRGAGPTMLSFVPQGSGNKIERQMHSILPNADIKTVHFNCQGLRLAKVKMI